MILIFLFFRRATAPNSSTRRTIIYSTLAGLSLYYLAASWACILLPTGLAGSLRGLSGCYRAFFEKVFLAYSICMGIFMLLTPFLVPKIGFASLSDLTLLVVPAGEVVLLASEASTYIPNGRVQLLTLVGAIVATAVVVFILSYFNIIANPAGKFYAVINPLVRGDVPIIQSVAEHQPATWGSFFYELGPSSFLTLFGFVFITAKGEE